MAVRTTMADLIQRVRDLAQAGTAEYTLGTVSYWGDQQIQDLLDARRKDVRFEQLESVPAHAAGGSLTYTEYRACDGFLETTDGGTATFVVQDSTGSVQTASGYSVDYLRGVVTFTANRAGTLYYWTGQAYDVYGAAADLLDAWAARLSRAYDVSADGQSLKRSQMAEGLRAQAAQYRAQAWPVTIEMVRGDAAPPRSNYPTGVHVHP